MDFLKKLHNRHETPGLEWSILKKLPYVLLVGTAAALLLALLPRLFIITGSEEAVVQQIGIMDIYAIAIVLTLWTAVFTVAIGCVVVVLMKGPAYVADAYELIDASKPHVPKKESANEYISMYLIAR